ncbi:MAG: tol-pal system-associated acyl-CoA thioesterase [Gammaproteobacteria bacterium]|nr:tol-pal system-associated acyl-CoA thioesterase [Gammaproteobacteria bacterium]MBV9621111.1 tol-pal system-associated acyl-CoA thioesterase [Gammaproteobacteria bacterium]
MGFSWPVRVYWEDTDGGAVVYYANYLRFLERARTEWLRAQGYAQRELAQRLGILFTVVSLHIDYRSPARLDDELEVTCEPRLEGSVSLRFAQHVSRRADATRAAQLLAEASVRVACVDAVTLKPKRLPDFVLRALPQPEVAHG